MRNVKVSTTPSGCSNTNNKQQLRSRMVCFKTVAILEIVLILNTCIFGKILAMADAVLAGSVDSAGKEAAATPPYLDVSTFDVKKDRLEPIRASTNVEVDTEILQFPHAFQHQEHYSHRIEQAINDFRRAQQEQRKQFLREHNNATKPFMEESNKHNEYNENNDSNKNEQHHRRHEQHLKQRQHPQHHHHHQHHHHGQHQAVAFSHHLRHGNRHRPTWDSPSNTFPDQEDQQHNRRGNIAPKQRASEDVLDDLDGTHNELDGLSRSPSDTLNVTNALQTRYFDRESLYSNSRIFDDTHAEHTTRGPRTPYHHHRHHDNAFESETHTDVALADEPFKRQRKEYAEKSYEDDDEESDNENNDGRGNDKANQLSGKRFSLNLSDSEMKLESDSNGFGQTSEHANATEIGKRPADNNDADDDDDYLYEDADSTEEQPPLHETGSFNAKVAVKRYTNPFKTSIPKQFETAYDDDTDYRNDDRDPADYDEKAKSSDDENSSEESTDSDIETSFSRDRWNHIEHQHHLKQQQHQRELQLRLHHTPGSSHSHSQSYNNNYGEVQNYNKDEEDTPNIFSRNYIPGTLTRQKQDELGTLEAVQQSRRNHVIKQMQNKALANAHAKQIFSDASCRLPQRRVERIQRDPTKIYTPHCTVLHRCADDTGCCKSDRQTCAPKRTKSVDLYFFVKSINDKRGTIERLTFINHTECHCVEKAKQQPSEYGSTALYGGSGNNVQLLRRATILNCNCPRLYEKILQEDGFCRCDCSSGNTGCDWLKRGMEHFSMIDRKCISEGRCKPPTCAYGSYMKKHGRCWRREEQLSAALIVGGGGGGDGGAVPPATNPIKTRGYH